MSTTNRTLVEARDNVAIYRDRPNAYAAFRRISWGAVFAGAVTALAVLILLNLLGLAIGMSTINPTTEDNALKGLGIGTAIWFGLSNLVALFAGGWVAGRLCGFPKKSTSMIHGFLAWAAFAVFSFWVASSAVGSIFNTIGSTISRTAGLAGNAISSAAPAVGDAIADQADKYDLTFDDIQREAEDILKQTGKPALNPDNYNANSELNQAENTAETAAENPQNADQILGNYVDQLKNRASGVANQVDKDAVANVVAERRSISKEEARRIVDGWDSRLEQAKAQADAYAEEIKQRAPEVAENIAEGVAKAALFAFIGLLLGAGAAIFGGGLGRQLDEATYADQAIASADVA